MVERPKSARHALPSLLMRMFAFGWVRLAWKRLISEEPVLLSNLHEPCGGCACTPSHSRRQPAGQRQPGFVGEGIQKQRTSSVRFTCLSFLTNSLMFPCSIHSETIANRRSLTVTPSKGRTLGCWRCFQATPSRQKLCNPFVNTGMTTQVEDLR